MPPHPFEPLPEVFAPDGVEPYFQPIVEIPSGRIAGFEALARWRHPRRGVLGADALLAAAARAGRVAQLGELVLRRSTATAAAWDGPLAGLRVSINITAADLRRRDFDAEVTLALFETGLPASRLTLELTEGALVDNFEAASVILGRLRDSGVRIAIDDFGTGYSSLSYLKGLPVDVVKLDRSLVTDVAVNERDLIIVHGIVEMAHSLGLRVVAEGVERPDQLARLAQAGCEWYQGFLCSMPMPAAALAGFVGGWNGQEGVRG
jgi:EAL domain-containing protein (putative c-di-GMP-specific phosphodiesterase class I)